MAKPLPKTKAPAFRKNRKRVPTVVAVAAPAAPGNSFSSPTKAGAARCESFHRGGALIDIEMSPEQEEPDDFGFLPCSRDRQRREERPQQPIVFQRRANQLVGTPRDNRDDCGSNAVEHSLNPRQPPVMQVERGKH